MVLSTVLSQRIPSVFWENYMMFAAVRANAWTQLLQAVLPLSRELEQATVALNCRT